MRIYTRRGHQGPTPFTPEWAPDCFTDDPVVCFLLAHASLPSQLLFDCVDDKLLRSTSVQGHSFRNLIRYIHLILQSAVLFGL